MRLNGNDYSGYPNAQLDQTYADAYAGYNATTGSAKLSYSQTMSDTGQEILNRLGTPLGFVDALFSNFVNASPFPQFDAIQKNLPQGFNATQAANASVGNAASNVGTTLTSAAGNVLSTGKYLGFGVGLLALYLLLRRK